MDERLSAPRMVDRTRITRLLQRGLATGHVFLTAPAGYGKSVALDQLAAHRPDTHRISLTSADRDPITLSSRLRSLLAPHHTILVDDAHVLVGAMESCVWLQEQLDRPQPRWILAGRRLPFDPGLLVINGQALFLTQEDLTFTLAEAQQILDRQDAQVQEWQERLQGWALGLSLLARMPARDDPVGVAQEHLFRYLAETVFDRLPPELQRFLRTTAVPLRFNRELVRAIWPAPEQVDGLLAEAERRNLYLQPAGPPGWLQYHELIRDFLLRRRGEEGHGTAHRVVAWHRAQGDDLAAMEQALDSGLTGLAADLLASMPLSHFHTHTSYLTYRRWVHGLDDQALAAHPMLLVRLANILGMMGGYGDEARAACLRGARLASSQGDQRTRLLAEVNLALLDKLAGRLAQARRRIQALLDEEACTGYPRLFALRIAGLIAGELGDGGEAARFAEMAMALAPRLGAVNERMMARANRMHHFLLPRGRFAAAATEIAQVLAHFGDAPGWRSQYLVNLCDLYAQQGSWDALAEALAELERLVERVEAPTAYVRLWREHFRTVLAVATGTPEEVDAALAAYQALAEGSPLHRSGAGWLAVWHLRRQGKYDLSVERGESLLADRECAPFYRPHLGLERDMAQGLACLAGQREEFTLHPASRLILRRRLGPLLLRLRALLAVVGHRAGDGRWRRHWRAAHRGLGRPGHDGLLTRLDPQLGAAFWRVGVREGLHLAEAASALAELGRQAKLGGLADAGAGLLPLLREEAPQVRLRAAEALARMGAEGAIPALVAAQEQEPDLAVQRQMAQALGAILRQPPPRLTVQLLGGFALARGGQPVPAQAWSRPIVQRLFQYFAVHAGEPIPKERLLDDLWPDLDAKRGWRNFRTVHSLLRRVLEPYMPPKGPNRYFAVSGETYTFDPGGAAETDLARFRAAMRSVLSGAQPESAPPLPAAFLQALAEYAPLLPELPYAEWLLAARQEAEELHLAGCHHAAQVYLAQGGLVQAIHWAEQVVQRAPWHEEAYQVLMRAHARRGQRAQALRVYQQAIQGLHSELNVEPSSLTRWLAQRLRQGQDI